MDDLQVSFIFFRMALFIFFEPQKCQVRFGQPEELAAGPLLLLAQPPNMGPMSSLKNLSPHPSKMLTR